MRPLVLAAVFVSSLSLPAQSQPTPAPTTPRAFLGHDIGADHFLANYTQLRRYWNQLDTESDRLRVTEIGTTSYGQPMVMAIITAPANHANLDRYREISATLARAASIDDAQARALAAEGKAVVWIDAGMHATESVAAQNILELVYQLVSRDDAETREILANTILLVVPANPDGMEMIANGYMATRQVGQIPVLYQRYIGHDNNRDFYMANLPETEAINNQLYRTWYPQVVYNHHQSAPRGTIIFTPPFRDPFNYNFDPLVVRGLDLVANHINSRFAWEQKAGVISRSGARYSTWWNGGLRTTAYFHNMIGILTEVFGHPTPTEVTQSLNRRLPFGDYPMPIPSGKWHARQTIDYLQTANRALLLLAARYRQDFLYNIYQMGRNSIQRGRTDHWTVTPRLVATAKARGEKARRKDDPNAETDAVTATFTDPKLRDAWGYLLPPHQRDAGAVHRLVRALLKCGVEVQRLTRSEVLERKRYPEGTYYIDAAQAFRPHVRDMLEPQWHPDDIGSSGEPVRPYDSAGWTLALQMAVDVDRVYSTLQGPFEPVHLDTVRPEPGVVTRGRTGYLIAAGNSANYRCVNRLLAAGQRVLCLKRPVKVGRREFGKGTLYVPRTDKTEALAQQAAHDLGIDFTGVDTPPASGALALRPLRIGLFDVYGGDMATGWTEWILRQNEFPVQLVFGARIHEGELRKDFDVLIFHTGLPDPGGRGRVQRALRRGRPSRIDDEDVAKLVEALPPFEDWSTAAQRRVRLDKTKAVPVLSRFMDQGGVLLALGTQAVHAAGLFDAPVEHGLRVPDEKSGEMRAVRRSEFFIPGSLLQLELSDQSMVTAGLPSRLAGMYRSSPVLRVREANKAKALARYAEQGDVLVSGWAIGAEFLRGWSAAVEVPRGDGKLYLFGVDAVYRGQPQGTINMVLNAVMLGAAGEASATKPR